MMRIIRQFIFVFALLPFCVRGETTNNALARATAAVAAATPRAQADPTHPIFHVTSPAQWMNDPNGPIFYHGYYHLFYQLNPFSDGDGPKHWGHVRSRDLAHWEPLPIALAPSTEAGESGIWSGCCTINGLGQPMIFYTSVAQGKSAFDHAEQWAATSDDDLIHWKKSPANPVLSEPLHGDRKIYDWRDPFVFHAGQKTFLVTGGHLEKQGHAAVNIYEATNSELTKWTYRGPLFELPDLKVATAECPNFFQLGDQWVLFVSPYGQVQYFIGDFDAATCRFHPHTHGIVDSGSSFYAPNTMQLPTGRRLVWAWVNSFPAGHGWNGCLSLPRVLSLSTDGQLHQQPAPELTDLRTKPTARQDVRLDDHVVDIPLPKTNAMEIQVDVDLNAGAALEMKLKSGAQDAKPITLTFNGHEITVMDSRASLQSVDGHALNLRIFIDRTVLEVFANETVCFTKVIPLLDANSTLELHTSVGTGTANLIRIWPMQTIW